MNADHRTISVRPERESDLHAIHLLIAAAFGSEVLNVADERSEPLVVLEGSPRYSSRFGFEHSLSRGIEIDLPDWAPPEAAQVKLLGAFDPHDHTLRGKVIHPAAFDGLNA